MEMYKKYKQQINYLIFGGLTTLINIVTYIFFYDILAFSNLFSNIMAWIFSVLFAYVTNKLWVFESKTNGFSALLKELSSFVGCRLATGVLDIVIMYVGVDILLLSGTLMKLFSNVIVIILNYVLSKILIFSKSN